MYACGGPSIFLALEGKRTKIRLWFIGFNRCSLHNGRLYKSLRERVIHVMLKTSFDQRCNCHFRHWSWWFSIGKARFEVKDLEDDLYLLSDEGSYEPVVRSSGGSRQFLGYVVRACTENLCYGLVVHAKVWKKSVSPFMDLGGVKKFS